jgi:hypothetical protein
MDRPYLDRRRVALIAGKLKLNQKCCIWKEKFEEKSARQQVWRLALRMSVLATATAVGTTVAGCSDTEKAAAGALVSS